MTTKTYSLTVIFLYIIGVLLMLATVWTLDLMCAAVGVVLFGIAKTIRLLKRIEEASRETEQTFVERPASDQPAER